MVISEEEHKQMPEPVRERLEALKDAPGSVIVVGSMNADYTVTTKRLPKPGETVNGGAMKVLPGRQGRESGVCRRSSRCQCPVAGRGGRGLQRGLPIKQAG